MTRKDSEKDSERPHYYSQFWLDVAAGRRTIGGPKLNEEGEIAETELPEVVPQRKGGHANEHETARERGAAVDGRAGNIVHPVAEPVADDNYAEPEPEDLATDEEEEITYQDTAIEDEDIPDMDLSPVDEEEEGENEEDFFDDEEEDNDEEEEEEEDLSWGRGRKKAKPGRQTKLPPKKPTRRDRRGGY